MMYITVNDSISEMVVDNFIELSRKVAHDAVRVMDEIGPDTGYSLEEIYLGLWLAYVRSN